MATRVASLFAEIGLKTDKLDAGLNKAKTGFSKFGRDMQTQMSSVKKFGSGLNDTVTQLTGFNLAQLGAAGAVALVAKQVGESIRFFADYAEEVRTMSAATGMSNEETSKMIQLFDDANVDIGLFTRASRTMVAQGLQPSVDNMAKLADEFNALQDPVAKSQLLIKNFGMSGMAMGKLMAMGGDAIREAGESAELFGQVLDDDAIKAAEEYRMELDNLADASEGLKLKLGQALVPVLADVAGEMNRVVGESLKMDKVTRQLDRAVTMGLISQKEVNDLYADLSISGGNFLKIEEKLALLEPNINDQRAEMARIMQYQVEVTDDLALAQDELKGKYEDLSTVLGGTMGQATRDFRASMYDLNQEAIVLQDNIDNLEGKKYLTESQKASLAEAKTRLGENQTEVKKLAEEHDKASKQIILGFVQQAAAADGVITQQEFDKIAELGKAWGLYDEETATAIANSKAYLEDGGMSVDELTGKIDTTSGSINTAIGKTRNFAEELAKLKDKTITITVKTKGNLGASGGILAGGPGGAHGLDMVVPPGHPNDSFPVFATSGERVTITPPGNKGAGGGNTFGDINIFVDGGDADATADAVFSRFSEATRAASNAGIGFAG